MIKYIYDINTGVFLRLEQGEPVCGKDFCDSCGDCLSCYWEDPCYGNDSGEHFWVEYVDEEENGKRS